jgi:transposase
MPQNFVFPQRDQPLLLPVDMRGWLPEDDLVFVVLDAVATLDLGGFRRRCRSDGNGRAAFDPEMMVALLLYGYCQGERSSRVIEKRCVRDVGYRVIAGGLCPDHATIARFRTRHEEALGGLFSQVLRLLAAEGMVSLGLLSLDETKLAGNAARKANRTLPQIEKILAEAAAADAAEDAREGATRSRRSRGYWPGGLNGGSGWPGPGTGSRWKTRRAGTHSGPSRRPGKRPRRPGSAADTARAMSRAPTGPAPSHGRTSPIRTCG